MDQDERPVERETTVINTGGGGGSGGTIVALVVLLFVALGIFLYFGGFLDRAAGETDINVNVEAPKIELPDVKIETPPAREEPAGQNKQ